MIASTWECLHILNFNTVLTILNLFKYKIRKKTFPLGDPLDWLKLSFHYPFYRVAYAGTKCSDDDAQDVSLNVVLNIEPFSKLDFVICLNYLD